MKRSNLITVLSLPLLLVLGGCMKTYDDFALSNKGPAYSGSDRHPIHVSRNGKSAHVHNCGDWKHDVTDDADNQLTDNHGCAVQSNIAAMAANPNDLRKPAKVLGDRNSKRDVSAVSAVSGSSAGGASSGDASGGIGG